jgi:hypothetical protein
MQLAKRVSKFTPKSITRIGPVYKTFYVHDF